MHGSEILPSFAKWYSGKTVLVTGASSGIGQEIVRQLTLCGSNIIPVGRNLDNLPEDLNLLKFISIDLSSDKSLDTLIDYVNSNFDIDILVNSAGFGCMKDFCMMSPDKIWAMQKVNIMAIVSLCQAFLPKMVRKKGTGILNIGSVASFFPTPGSALYGATKQFILGFTDALHQELLNSGVHVTGLYPGNTHSRFIERASDGRVKKWEKAMEPSVVARAGLYGLSKNKLRVIPGFNNKLKVFLAKILR